MSHPYAMEHCANHGYTLFMQRIDANGQLLYSCQACAKAEGFYEQVAPEAAKLYQEALNQVGKTA